MDLSKLIGMVAEGVIPEEIAPLVEALIEGRVKQFAAVAELDDGTVIDAFPVLDETANRMVMVGALEVVKRDYMRIHVRSRVEYVEIDEEG
jgi:hypothetical protein